VAKLPISIDELLEVDAIESELFTILLFGDFIIPYSSSPSLPSALLVYKKHF
jgi:hypothetical protein